MHRTIFLLLLLCLGFSSSVDGAWPNEEVAEGGTITLECISIGQNALERSWYKGAYSDINPPNLNDAFFIQKTPPNGDVTRVTAPPHMDISDPTTFDLVITGAMLNHSDDYTCVTVNDKGVPQYETGHVQVYIQPSSPEMVPDPSKVHNITDGEGLFVTCTVPRLYPAIRMEDFIMKLGERTLCPGVLCNLSPQPQDDASIKYTLSHVWWLEEYSVPHGGITCTIRPAYGSMKTSKPLKVNVVQPRGLSGGAIAGIVIGCVAGVVLISAGVFYGIRYSKKGATRKTKYSRSTRAQAQP